MALEFIQYSTEEVLRIFNQGLGHLPDQMSETFKAQFSDEIIKNVFNDVRRFELSLKEEDIIQISKRSDRGLSIDEGPELADSIGAAVGSVDNNHQSDSQTE